MYNVRDSQSSRHNMILVVLTYRKNYSSKQATLIHYIEVTDFVIIHEWKLWKFVNFDHK